MRHRFSIFAAALWWGSLTGLGFLVVPMLFMHLGTPAAAGAMAAKLFTAQTWLSIGCAMLLLLICNQKELVAPDLRARTAIKFIVTGFFLVVLVEFGLSPRIVSARVDGGSLKLWHGLGSAMYLGQWICSGCALWSLCGDARPLEKQAASVDQSDQ